MKTPAGVAVECLECGRKFVTRSLDPSCPKCHGSDIELAVPVFAFKGGA